MDRLFDLLHCINVVILVIWHTLFSGQLTWVRHKFIEPKPMEKVLDHFSQISKYEGCIVGICHDDCWCKEEASYDLVVVLWPLREQHLSIVIQIICQLFSTVNDELATLHKTADSISLLKHSINAEQIGPSVNLLITCINNQPCYYLYKLYLTISWVDPIE